MSIRETLDVERLELLNLDPVFLTGDGAVRLVQGREYECVVTDELVAKEMTKREQRRSNK